MRKTILMSAALAMVLGMASCSDNDDKNDIADLGQAVSGQYLGKNGSRSKFKVQLGVPSVMGGLTLTFTPNK